MMCTEKVAYRTLVSAADAAVEQLDKHDRVQRPYECDRCTSFHLTSKPMHGSDDLTANMVRQLATALGIMGGR